MNLKYFVTVEYKGHTRSGEINIELSKAKSKQLLRDLSTVILKYQPSAIEISHNKFGPKAKAKELTLAKIDLSDDFGDNLDLCYECGKVLQWGDECPICGVTFLNE